MQADIDTEPVRTILLVEDEVLIRFHIADYLRDCGFIVIEAATAVEALTVLNSDEPVDLVVTDIEMPGSMNGIDLGRWMREHRPDVELVIASGAVKLAGEAAELCNGSSLLQKPFSERELLARIRQLLGDRPPTPLVSMGVSSAESAAPKE